MRTRRFAISAVAAVAILCTGQSYAKGKIDTVTYEVKMSGPTGDMGTRKMYRKGDYFVWENESAGMKLKFIKNKDGCFTIHPAGRYAAKYPAGSNRESTAVFLPGPAGDVREFLKAQEAKKETEEKVGEKLCEVYSYTEKETKWKCKLWLAKTTMTPVKMVMNGAKKTDVIDVTYVSYKTGVVVAESRFKLPEGIEIRPMPEPKKPDDAKKADGDKKQENADAKAAEPAEAK